MTAECDELNLGIFDNYKQISFNGLESCNTLSCSGANLISDYKVVASDHIGFGLTYTDSPHLQVGWLCLE
jgi:hypothetical protein